MVCKMRFAIQITETLQRVIEVEASSVEDAEMIVRRRYYSGEPILDASDHVATEIMPVAVIERFGSLDSAQEILLL